MGSGEHEEASTEGDTARRCNSSSRGSEGDTVTIEERVQERFEKLMVEAVHIRNTARPAKVMGGDAVDTFALERWLVSVSDALHRVFGSGSQYCAHLETAMKAGPFSDSLRRLEAVLAVLHAAARDFEAGYAQDLQELIAGEVFSDFLDMAKHLADEYAEGHVPAASVAGAVLEDALRRLHTKHIAPWEGDSKISVLNDALKKANVYPQAQWRQIQTWADIRNEADHGHFENVDAQQVTAMLQGIGDFIAKYLT